MCYTWNKQLQPKNLLHIYFTKVLPNVLSKKSLIYTQNFALGSLTLYIFMLHKDDDNSSDEIYQNFIKNILPKFQDQSITEKFNKKISIIGKNNNNNNNSINISISSIDISNANADRSCYK